MLRFGRDVKFRKRSRPVFLSTQNKSDFVDAEYGYRLFRCCDLLYGEQRYLGFKDIYEALGRERISNTEALSEGI